MISRLFKKKPGGKQFFVNAIAGSAQAIITSFFLFFLYRFLLGHLGVKQLGVWSLLMAWLSLARIGDFGLSGAMVRFASLALTQEGQHKEASNILKLGIIVSCFITAIISTVISILLFCILPTFLAGQKDLPWVLLLGGLSAWLGCVLVAIRAGLDALQRVDLRHVTIVVQNGIFLLGVFMLVDRFGLGGVFLAQILAVGFTVVMSSMVFYFELRGRNLLGVSLELRWNSINKLFSYGIPFQITTITGFLLDPLVKMLLGSYADLNSVTWYEMASKLISQVRAVVVNAMEALVPHVAALGGEQRLKILSSEYRRAYLINLALATLGLGLVVANLPLISLLWIDQFQPTFLIFSSILGIIWWFNALGVPAYFVAQGLGIQRWNLIAHVIMSIVNLFLGVVLGLIFGGLGVLFALSFSLVVGTMISVLGLHYAVRKSEGILLNAFIPFGYFFAGVVFLPVIVYFKSEYPPLVYTISVLSSIVLLWSVLKIKKNKDLIDSILVRLFR